jgi:glycosyltransferase involved in cell wall biosynthesis
MKVSGFTFIRNAVQYDFPIVEAIKSILPLCDEVVVAVGKSDDDTLQLIRSIGSNKVKIIETVWNNALREGGRVLADETDKAFDAISPDSDWAFYVQGDEAFHEKDLPAIKEAMHKYLNDMEVEGLLFEHINLYGSYDYIADSRKWVKKEIRVIRNNKDIRSWKDAMSFRWKDGRKLNVKMVDATIYHYGWVKPPKEQMAKRASFEKLWHDDKWIEQNVPKVTEFDYSGIDSLSHFNGTHPAVMQDRINNANWKFTFDPTKAKQRSLRLLILNWIYQKTGILIGGFKNYKVLK